MSAFVVQDLLLYAFGGVVLAAVVISERRRRRRKHRGFEVVVDRAKEKEQ